MTRKELDNLKIILIEQREKAADIEALVGKFSELLDSVAWILLPDDIKAIIEKYKKN